MNNLNIFDLAKFVFIAKQFHTLARFFPRENNDVLLYLRRNEKTYGLNL